MTAPEAPVGRPVRPRKPADLEPDWAFTIAVTLVAVLPRLFVAIAWAREPVWDGHYYHFGASRIAEGLGYSEDVLIGGAAVWRPWCHYPVGYSAWLGGLYWIFGPSLLVAPIANALTGAATVTVAHRVGRYFLSVPRARIAAGLIALHPGLIIYSAVLMTEPLTALLLLTAGWLAVAARRDATGSVWSGLTIGLATLVRPSALLAAPLLAVTARGKARRFWIRGAVATLLALVVVAPWTLRNCRVMDGCAFVSTNGGWNLAIGALSETGRFRTLRAADGCPVVTGQVQQDRCWAKVGRDAILADPMHWLGLVPKKLAQTYDHESFAVEYLREAAPELWPNARRQAGRALMTTFHWALLFLATLGVIGRPPARPRGPLAIQLSLAAAALAFSVYAALTPEHPFFWLPAVLPLIAMLPLPGAPWFGPIGRYLVGLVLATTLTHAVFFGDDRYHLVVTPALCLLAAGALRRAA